MRTINSKFNLKTYEYDIIDSTNNQCKRLHEQGEETALVIANGQSCGKGRLSRSFYSPKDSGIYMSLLLRPSIKAEDCVLITTAAAVAVSNAIDKITGKKSLIKWVNDIYLENKKVCGILCEAGFKPQEKTLDYIILGIGINLYTRNFPDDIKDKAGSLFEKEVDTKEALINSIVTEFFTLYEKLPQKDYMSLYREKSMLMGKEVSFIKDGTKYVGTVEDINDNAEIIIKTKENTVTLFAGEVSLEF